MPAKDHYHDTVKRALIKDGWIIEDEKVAFNGSERQAVVDLQISEEGHGIWAVIGFQGRI